MGSRKVIFAVLCIFSPLFCTIVSGDIMKKGIFGALCGFLNGFFGSGGGVVAVPLLNRLGFDARKSHATSVALIFFLSLVSSTAYFIRGNIPLNDALSFIPPGLAGAVMGAVLLKKIDNNILRRIFGVIIIVSSVRIFFQ